MTRAATLFPEVRLESVPTSCATGVQASADEQYQYDLFFSCASANIRWVDGFLLPALGLRRDRVISNQLLSGATPFQEGAPLSDEIGRVVRSSRFTLLVLSPAYFAGVWTVHSAQLASYLTVQERRTRLIPLELENSRLPLDIEFRVRLDCTQQDNWEAVAARLRELLKQPEPEPERIPCPYPGMVAFRAKDARFFYGREDEIEGMLRHLRYQRHLWVIGPSGSGKSSLVFGGLLPKLTQSTYFSRDYWLLRSMRLGSQPVDELNSAIGGDPSQAQDAIAGLLSSSSPAQRLLLIIDQFEELFSQSNPVQQSRFIAAIKALRAVEACALLIAMRADFYPDLMNSDLWPVDVTQRLEIAPLRGDALRKSIERPAADMGVYLESELVERILVDAADEPGVLPLVQETMVLLWEKMQRRLLTLGTYEHLGAGGRTGLAAAIAAKADSTLAELSAEQRAVARRIFLRLVQFGEGRADTRRQQTVTELASSGDAVLFKATLEHLAGNRLLTLSGEDKEDSAVKADISHEALITGWHALHDWITQRREAEKTRRRLEARAQEWARLGSGGGALLDAVQLAEAELWLKSADASDLGCSPDLAALVQGSREAIQRTEQEREAARQQKIQQAKALAEAKAREARTFKIFSVAVLIIAAAAIVLAVLAYGQSQTSKSRQLAAEANAEFVRRPDRALALAVRAARVKTTYEASEQLLTFVQTTSNVEHILFGDKEPVGVVSFSSDGQYLVSEHFNVGLVHRLMVWDANTGKPLGPPLYPGEYLLPTFVAMGPNGTIVTVNTSGFITVWDPASGTMVHRDKIGMKLPGPITMLAAASTGRVAVLTDGSVLWWDMQGQKPIGRPLSAHNAWVTATAFSKDGRSFATGDGEGRVVVWNAEKASLASWTDYSQGVPVTALAFSEDAKLLAWACQDGTVVVWDIERESARQRLFSDKIQPPIDSIVFREGAQKLVGLDQSGVMIEWSLPAGPSSEAESVDLLHLPEPIAAHALSVKGIGAAAWGPEGNVILLGKDIAPSVLKRASLANLSISVTAKLSQDGQRIAVQLKDGAVIIQDMAQSQSPFTIRPEGGDIQSMAWITRERLAIGTKDGRTSLWDAITRRRLSDLPTAATPISPMAFSSDGKRLVSWGGLKQRRLWKIGVEGIGELPAPKPLRDIVSIMTAAFSPDGNLLALGTLQGALGVWDLRRDRWAIELVNLDSSGVYSTAFSPNGRWLAVGYGSGYVILWDVERGRQFGPGLKIFAKGVSSVAFSTDSKRLMATDDGQNLAFLNLDPESWIMRVCRLGQPTLTKPEWKRFMGDQPYPTTCGEAR
jgi:WD40 repeat protein